MKNSNYIKAALVPITFLTIILLITSFSNIGNNNHVDVDDNNKNDSKFLVSAAEMNYEEIQLGKLAQKNGSTAEVRELGKMMVESHTKFQSDLTSLAKSKSITIPAKATDGANDDHTKLSEKKGNDFDKDYTDQMVKRHKDAISLFEKASTDSEDADIQKWAIATLPDLRTHLDRSVECQKKCEEKKSKENKTEENKSEENKLKENKIK